VNVIPGGLISQQCPPSRIVGIGFGQHKAWLERAKACEACVACVGKLAWGLPPTQSGQAKKRRVPRYDTIQEDCASSCRASSRQALQLGEYGVVL